MAQDSFSPFSNSNNPLLRRVSQAEAEDLCPVRNIFKRTAATIAKWPDFHFETADGRQFLLFQGGDSIRHRLQATEGDLTPEEVTRLDSCSAIIHEVGSPDQPLVFCASDDEAADAWLDLHRLFREPLGKDEIEFFGVDNEELFNAE